MMMRLPSVPDNVAIGDEHSRMANGKEVDFIFNRFVDNAVRAAECLSESFSVLGNFLETLGWDCGADVWKRSKRFDSFAYAIIPSEGILCGKFVANLRQNLVLQNRGAGRPENIHIAVFFLSSSNQRDNIARVWHMASSCGIPLPAANSRRDVSMSRESSMLSKSLSSDSASTRYEAARPFCVMRTGRCVLRTRPMYIERLLRHSENGTTSSDGRQRRSGISRTFCMTFPYCVSTARIVQNIALLVKGAASPSKVTEICGWKNAA